MFVSDYIFNDAQGRQQAFGPVASEVANVRWDPGLRRPFLVDIGGRRIPCCSIKTGMVQNTDTGQWEEKRKTVSVEQLQRMGIYSPVFNATQLRKEEWDLLDAAVLRAARFRVRAWPDLASRNPFGGFNGMAKTMLEHETMSDAGEAFVDMTGLSEGRNDAPVFQLQAVPLPITHSNFNFDARKLAESRNSGTPLDVVQGEMAARRVFESVEKTLIGVNTGIVYGGNSTQTGGYGYTAQVYGYTNFVNRLTYTSVVAPTAGGYTASKTLTDVLAMLDLLKANRFFGPFMLYHSNDWDKYMDTDYILTGGNVATQTLRERLRAIEDIIDVRRLDFLFSANIAASKGPGGEGFTATGTSPFTLLMVQMTPDVCQAVNGLDVTTVQWEEKGGMMLLFKVMCIQVPRLRSDYYGNCGICHGTTA